jgi:hypothetical protein
MFPLLSYPSMHVHLLRAILPSGETELAGQLVHSNLPIVALYVPLGQATHSLPFGPVNPTWHSQSANEPLRLGDVL